MQVLKFDFKLNKDLNLWYNSRMFTGIVEEVGKIQSITENKVVVGCRLVLDGTKIGDSIAVNGVCLTVTELADTFFEADVSEETFRVSALSKLQSGSRVNLERALPADGRFGGHIVSGHIDGVGKIVSIKKNNEFCDLEINLEPDEAKYVVKKGSVAINGISLTVAEVCDKIIKIAVIPHTFENTSLKDAKVGDYVNIETDILSKYIEKFLSTGDNRSRISVDFLQRNGFC